MLVLRTLLLWAAFIMLVFLEFFTASDFRFSIIFRLVPSLFLMLWFVLYTLNRKKYVFRENVGRNTIRLIKLIRTVANIAIISGALLKLGHFQYSQGLLVAGIGFLALWSSLHIAVSVERPAYNPDIVDDMRDENKEE